MLAAAALAGIAALAVSGRALADESLSTTGSITYTWQGDPARGCAAAGLCGVHGELVLNAAGTTSALSFGGRTIDIPFFGSSGIVRVAGPNGDCVDVAGGVFGGDLFVTRVRGKLVGRMSPAPSSGRCAGPLEQDFARLTLPVTRSGGKRPSFDLRTSRSFTAGPFSGRMVSTLQLRPARGGGGFSSTSSGGSTSGTPIHTILLEQVTLRYRVARLPGTLDAAFSGEPDPFCSALGSCGISGNLAFSVGGFHGTIVATASRVVRRRVSPRQALADMRSGMLHFGNGGFPLSAPLAMPTTVNETLRAPDGTQCQAVSSSREAQLQIASASERLPHPGLEVSLGESGPPSLLRTYCPGPNDTDVFGPALRLTASLGPAQLLRRHGVFALSRSGSFAGTGYAGTRAGALRFSLALVHVQARTVQVATESREPLP